MARGQREPVAALRKPLERTVSRGHPWIYRDALDPLAAEPGSVVTVLDRRGRFLARGLAEAGPIAVRVFTLRDEPLGGALLARRVAAALELRDRLRLPETDALRLLHGEGDRLPGAVCDRYAQHAVLRLDGEAIREWLEPLVAALRGPLRQRGVEALLLREGRGAGKRIVPLWGRLPEAPIEVREHGVRLLADLVQGQKTGLFLDHRDSRLRVRALSGGTRVLNLYGYTGAFSVAAGLGGAREVVTVDSAPAAIGLAELGWARNGLPPAAHRGVAAEVQTFLGGPDAERFDLVIADPPSFAPSQASLPRALKAYRALHGAALGAVVPGGWYLAASCSSHVDRAAFEGALGDGAHDARRSLQVLGRWGAGADHPVPLGFPEGEYLKVTLSRVLD
jgi:23S rRNA (cytosine1962-C5)-methyltransferase